MNAIIVSGKAYKLHSNPLDPIVEQFNLTHGTKCINYAHALQESQRIVLEEIKADPLLRKVFNVLSNDIQGILKKVNNMNYSFDGGISDEFFVDRLVQLLLDNNFLEERWDKKQFKIDFEQWLTNQPEHGGDLLDTKVFLTYNEEIVRLTYQLARELKTYES
jgi:hypothetical protein